jgi:hypothetical protein
MRFSHKAINMSQHSDIPFNELPWPQRLEFTVATMREMSQQTDPQQMVQAYLRRVRYMIPSDRWMAISSIA